MLILESWLGTLFEVFIIYIIYKIIDRIIRMPYVDCLESRYILITGCDTGFGNLLAKRLDKLGCHVFAGCLTESGETELRKSCSSRLTAVNMDVTKTESIQKAFQLVKDKLPPGQGLWGLMNNAGIMGAVGMPDWMTIDDYRRVCDINMFGMIEVTTVFLPLIKNEKGRIVSTASIVGRVSLSTSIPYCLSKYGVEAFGDGMRRAMRPFGVKSIIIEPGGHRTHFMETQRLNKLYVEAWNQAPGDVKRDYGEEYFKYESTRSVSLLQKISSSNFDDVVDAYEHALLSRYPRARYVVGMDAKLFWIPLSYLPEWLGDALLRLGEIRKPLPAVAKRR